VYILPFYDWHWNYYSSKLRASTTRLTYCVITEPPPPDTRFVPKEKPAPEFLLAKHPPLAEGPFYNFEPHSSPQHFSFSKSDKFGFVGDIFVAQYWSQMLENPKGHKVVRFNLETKEVNDFYVNKVPGIEGVAPERPTAAILDPSGEDLYVLDFGELIGQKGVFWPSANTGALWKITKVESLGIAGFVLTGFNKLRVFRCACCLAITT
jgi:hypothetical protein